MLNYYDREANFPTDKASHKVLYSDYFHDSLITSVNILPEKHSVELHIQCSRECEWETGDWRKDIYDEKYGYVLTFSGVTHLNIHTDLSRSEYINGNFKAIPKGKYYFRIQTDDGYIDIGYHSFKLRRSVGRVSYRGIDTADLGKNRDMVVSEDRITAIIQRMKDDGYSEEDDLDLLFDLERLYMSGASDIAGYLRAYVSSQRESEDAVPYAAWLLGKYGNADDVPLILNVMNRAYEPLPRQILIRQNLTDAIEALSRVRPITSERGAQYV